MNFMFSYYWCLFWYFPYRNCIHNMYYIFNWYIEYDSSVFQSLKEKWFQGRSNEDTNCIIVLYNKKYNLIYHHSAILFSYSTIEISFKECEAFASKFVEIKSLQIYLFKIWSEFNDIWLNDCMINNMYFRNWPNEKNVLLLCSTNNTDLYAMFRIWTSDIYIRGYLEWSNELVFFSI